MTLSTEKANKVSASAIGLDEDLNLSNARVVEHLNPRLQKLFADAKAFKNQFQYAFCWVKNGSILLRNLAAKKAATRLYFLKQLKRAKVPPKDMLLFYTTCALY